MYVCGYPSVFGKKDRLKPFVILNPQKVIEDLQLFTKMSEICIFCGI